MLFCHSRLHSLSIKPYLTNIPFWLPLLQLALLNQAACRKSWRNVRQLWEGGFRWRTICFETAAWLTSMPSLSNSLWILGAPHRGFVLDMLRIRSRTSSGIFRLTGHLGRLFHLQYSRNPLLYQRITVSGWTTSNDFRQSVQKCDSIIHRVRSRFVKRGLFELRLKTSSWWRSAEVF